MARLDPGRFNRRLTLEARTVGQDGAGGRTESWAVSGYIWAEQVSTNERETILSEAERNEKFTVFRIRWRDNFTSGEYRVTYKGRKFNINGVQEESIKETMLITCEAIQNIEG